MDNDYLKLMADNLKKLKEDKELDPLRARGDFQALLRQLEKG